VDTPVALQETGDLVIPIENGILEEKNILPIWDIMMNQVQARGETRFFKSVGMAAFDLYGAKLIYESLS
jgi:ornithine cyclodeaminase